MPEAVRALGRTAVATALAVSLVASLAGCTPGSDPAAGPEGSPRPASGRTDLSGCDRVSFAAVRGPRPSYLEGPLSRLVNDDALCGGRWLPRAERSFVPQGLSVRGGTAWVSGFDEARVGRKYCRVLRVDLATGGLEAQSGPVTGSVGTAPPVRCLHGGGTMLDEHGLWLTESPRLWLLDPASLEVRRAWRFVDPVQGSFGVLDGRGRLGVGRYRSPAGNPAQPGPPALDWFDLEDLLAPGRVEIGPGLAVASRRIPLTAQGAVWTRMAGRTGVWLALSTTRCGVLVGPGGLRRAFVPGAEGMARSGGSLWVASESTARPYVEEGGRPVVPTLSRLDVTRLARWAQPDCSTG